MSAPRTKRQFAGASADPAQRQITSFFASCSPEDAAALAASTTDKQGKPVLSESVQSNLLSVGMRVRKSVPEGYKTGSMSAFKLWTDNTPLPTPSRPAQPSSTTTTTMTRAASRELLPFCGINSVGGLASQPDVYADSDDDVLSMDAVPELTMSQDSVESNADPEPPTRKRFFDNDNDLDESAADSAMSPRSLASASMDNARVMAVPRSRAKKSVAFKDVDQENMKTGDDFEDAEFLVFGEGRSMDTD